MSIKTNVWKLRLGLLLVVVGTFGTVCLGQRDKEGFVKIFDGKSLKGWEGDPKYWRVEKGILIGEITPETPLKTNSFLIWTGGEPADFELKGEFLITKDGSLICSKALENRLLRKQLA